MEIMTLKEVSYYLQEPYYKVRRWFSKKYMDFPSPAIQRKTKFDKIEYLFKKTDILKWIDDRKNLLQDCVTHDEAAQLLGITNQSLCWLRKRIGNKFPKPIAQKKGSKTFFLKSEIENFARLYKRKHQKSRILTPEEFKTISNNQVIKKFLATPNPNLPIAAPGNKGLTKKVKIRMNNGW